MIRLESVEDQMKGVVTYELKNGMRVRLDARAAMERGPANMIREMGHGDLLPTGRVSVYRKGKNPTTYGALLGTVPADFDPAFIKSNNFFYDPRPGDFTRDGENWIAAANLGPGDLEAVPGFVRFSAA